MLSPILPAKLNHIYVYIYKNLSIIYIIHNIHHLYLFLLYLAIMHAR